MNATQTIEDKFKWAFAVDTTRPLSNRRRSSGRRRNLQRYYITACSPRLKTLGVRAGMRYNEAKKLVPDMRVIVCNR